MNEPTTSPLVPPSRPLLWLLTLSVLALSLMANLFVAGLWLGHSSTPEAGPLRAALRQLGAHVPEPVRPALRRALFAERRALARELGGAAQSRRQIAELLEAPEPDRAALEAAFARLREHSGRAQSMLHAALVQTMVETDASTRAQWADTWRRGPFGRHGLAERIAPPSEEAPSPKK